MKIKIHLFIFLIFFSCNQKIASPDQNNSQLSNDTISLKIDSLLAKSIFNGVILITKGEQTLYAKAAGFSDLASKKMLTLEDQFVIGSISKQITAVLILKEIEKEKLKLTDKISAFIEVTNQSWAKKITVHHLLTHTHGISDLEKPLLFEEGTQFQYSQLGYELLAKILESINNKSFKAISTDFFAKHQLLNTFHPENKKYKKLVKGYVEAADKKMIYAENSLENYVPAGSFISTVTDLNHWNNLLYSGQLVSLASLKLMKTKYATRIHPIFEQIEYGYGLLFKEGEHDMEIGALGYSPGFVSACYYYPQSAINVIVLENTAKDLNNFKNTFKVHTEIMQLVKNIK